jgi:hypothetical protein
MRAANKRAAAQRSEWSQANTPGVSDPPVYKPDNSETKSVTMFGMYREEKPMSPREWLLKAAFETINANRQLHGGNASTADMALLSKLSDYDLETVCYGPHPRRGTPWQQ